MPAKTKKVETETPVVETETPVVETETENEVVETETATTAMTLGQARESALSAFADGGDSDTGFSDEDAGLGSSDIGAEHIILPRIGLLQALSKVVVADDAPSAAKAGAFWLTPFNRPLTDPDATNTDVSKGLAKGARLVVVRIMPTQRFWTPLSEGGGIVCESPSGDMKAVEPKGLCGAKLGLTLKKGAVIDVDWEGGTPTDNCHDCVYGPAAAAAAAGNPPTKRGNPWIPKRVEFEGEMYDIPDDQRAPKCTQGIDALVLVVAPAHDGAPPEIVPAFLTFARTSYKAGKQLAAMIKMSPSMPSWGSIFTISAKRVEGDKGTYYVSQIAKNGYANKALADMAKDLYLTSQESSYRPSMADEEHSAPASSGTSSAAPKTVDADPAAVNDAF
jgi:hypothetical protein